MEFPRNPHAWHLAALNSGLAIVAVAAAWSVGPDVWQWFLGPADVWWLCLPLLCAVTAGATLLALVGLEELEAEGRLSSGLVVGRSIVTGAAAGVAYDLAFWFAVRLPHGWVAVLGIGPSALAGIWLGMPLAVLLLAADGAFLRLVRPHA